MRVSSSLFVLCLVSCYLVSNGLLVSGIVTKTLSLWLINSLNLTLIFLTWALKVIKQKYKFRFLLWSQQRIEFTELRPLSSLSHLIHKKPIYIVNPPQIKLSPYTHAHNYSMNIFTLGSMDLTQWDFFSPSVSIWPILAFGHVQLFHFPNICVVAGGYAKPCRTGPADTDCEYETGPLSVVCIHRCIVLT